MPYSASYNEPQRALDALRAKRALRIGTTNCGPAVEVISVSTFAVVTENSAGVGKR